MTTVSVHVRVVGTGLIGTSLGIALCRAGFRVTLSDPSPTAARLARDLGAGEIADASTADPDLVVVAAPPDVAADVVVESLGRWPEAVVTDVASVKGSVADAVRDGGGDLTRYVGSHPMAGRERSGAGAARGDLFDGRAWVVVPTGTSRPDAVDLVRQVATAVGAAVSVMGAAEHDAAVAVVSHVPQVAASLVAGRLRDVSDPAVALAGQGLRDVTRIAAGDPSLWQQIVTANAPAVSALLRQVRDDLDRLLDAVQAVDRGSIGTLLDRGVAGTVRLPGKHGGPARADTALYVAVPDHPGELARLLADAGEIGVNVEDLHIDHDPDRPVGLVELTVAEDRVEHLQTSLEGRGWTTHR